MLRAGTGVSTLIDFSPTGKFHIGESIPPDMNPILRQLGIYEGFHAENHEPCYGSCSYWGSDNRGYNDTILSPFGHGWHVDRARFNQFLVDQAIGSGVKVLSQCEYQSSEVTEPGHQLNFVNGSGEKTSVDADFVVDASGARGVFATQKGSQKVSRLPLVCLGLRFRAKDKLEASKLTHLESVEQGWWYAARIPGEQLLVTLYTSAQVLKALGLQDFQSWMRLLRGAPNTRKWIEHLEPADEKLLGFSAPSFCRDRVVGENWISIGDAASTYDPITAQGIIKSVSQGMQAAQIIGEYCAGEGGALARFEKMVHDQYKQYEAMRAHFYSLEQRWPESSFWKLVHGLKQLENAQ